MAYPQAISHFHVLEILFSTVEIPFLGKHYLQIFSKQFRIYDRIGTLQSNFSFSPKYVRIRHFTLVWPIKIALLIVIEPMLYRAAT